MTFSFGFMALYQEFFIVGNIFAGFPAQIARQQGSSWYQDGHIPDRYF
jgi:hypothetical protein